MSTKTWNNSSGGNWDTATDWSPAGEPGSTDIAVIPAGSGAVVIDDTTNAIDVASVQIKGFLQIHSPPESSHLTVVDVTGAVVVNNGSLVIDNDANGTASEGSVVTIGGKLTNEYGNVSIGSPYNAASYATSVTVGSYDAAFGSQSGELTVSGGLNGAAGGDLSTLTINSAAGFGAQGVVEGSVTVEGNASIIFKTAKITTIASTASLRLLGDDAFIADAGQTGSNSALAGLNEVDGLLQLGNGANFSTTTSLTLTGSVSLDSGTGGGSTLSVKGKLINDLGTITVDDGENQSGVDTTLNVGSYENVQTSGFPARLFVNGGTDNGGEAIMNIGSGANFGRAGIVDGLVSVNGNALVDFKSGQISTIASDGALALNGDRAWLADLGATNSNSALKGLKEIDGSLQLGAGADVATSASLTVAGTVSLDSGTAGGSTLSIAGKLTNDLGTITVGDGQDVAGVNTTLSVGSYENVQTTGFPARLLIDGGANAEAIMDIGSTAGFGAAGVVQGDVSLFGDALVDFRGGSLTSIATNGDLLLSGANAFVTNGSKTTSNAALAQLADVAGAFTLEDGAILTLAGALSVSGSVDVITQGDGASSLTLKSTLDDTGVVDVASQATPGAATLTVDGATTGAGSLVLGADATANLLGGVTGGLAIEFTGSGADAIIGDGPTASLGVSGYTADDTLDLRAETVTHLSYADSTLTLTLSTGQIQTFAFTGTFSSLTYKSDLHGGTEIVAHP